MSPPEVDKVLRAEMGDGARDVKAGNIRAQ
jgi:hypothetical protein